MDASVSARELADLRTSSQRPFVIDVRREAAWLAAPEWIDGALRRDPERAPEWSRSLPRGRSLVVYCVHGHEVSRDVAATLRAAGCPARHLDGGLDAWRRDGGAMQRKPSGTGTRWITRARPKIDRIACPWLLARFVDAGAEFVYVPAAEVAATATKTAAEPYDVAGARFGHRGDRCSFDAFIEAFALDADPALERLADIVRSADTDHLAGAPEAAGLLAISHGLGQCHADDHELLRHGMTLYDALHRWCGTRSGPAGA